VRPNKATPIKLFIALSVGLTSTESMPLSAERQIRFRAYVQLPHRFMTDHACDAT
jgi:hypothetical protein